MQFQRQCKPVRLRRCDHLLRTINAPRGSGGASCEISGWISADKVADGKPMTTLRIMKDLIANTPGLRGVFVSDPIMTQHVLRNPSARRSSDQGCLELDGAGRSHSLRRARPRAAGCEVGRSHL
jgi:hypothetical protein